MLKPVWLRLWEASRRTRKSLSRILSSGNEWKEIHVSSNKQPEPTLRRYSYLKNHGIKCKLQNLTSPSGRGIVAGMISLRVHHDDIVKAYDLLEEVRD